MNIQSNYILLHKNRPISKSVEKDDEKGKLVIDLKSCIGLPTMLSKCFGLKSEDWSDKVKLYRYAVSFPLTIDSYKTNIEFEIFHVQDNWYLNVDVKAKTKSQCVKAMNYINSKIFNSESKIEDEYIIITANDSVSEYYCNKIYPKFARFERSFRRLLFNIYVLNYGHEYYKKTISKNIADKAKGIIRAKKNKEEQYLKEFFYSLDYSDLQTILFSTNWTNVDEVEKEKFLADHDDLSVLSDEELRNFIDSIGPKSDWSRLFNDIIALPSVGDDINYIRIQRNKVAHNKFFTYEYYKDSLKILINLQNAVDKAIKLTQDQEFMKKNFEGYKASLQNISRTLEQFETHISEAVAPMKQLQSKISEMFKPYALTMFRIQEEMQPCYDSIRNIAESISDLNDEDTESENSGGNDNK